MVEEREMIGREFVDSKGRDIYDRIIYYAGDVLGIKSRTQARKYLNRMDKIRKEK